MVSVDEILDKKPTTDLVEELAELRIRNLICFEELESFNDFGKFKCKHPLVLQYSTHARMTDLFRNDPVKFMNEFKNTSNNITRYQSYLKSPSAPEEKKAKWKTQLQKHGEISVIMTEILKANGNNNSI